MQLRFASLAVINSWRDLHPQECARAGRTTKTRPAFAGLLSHFRTYGGSLLPLQGGTALHLLNRTYGG